MSKFNSRLIKIQMRILTKTPMIFSSCAHPQSVWFETHWLPIIERQNKDLDFLLKVVQMQFEELKKISDLGEYYSKAYALGALEEAERILTKDEV